MAQSPIEFCCSEIIRYLRDRKHPEAPHISTLSPDFPIKEILKKSLRICQSTLISDEDEEDEMPEDLDRIRGNSTFGVEADFSSLDDTGKVKFSCSFCFRQRIKARSEENADGHGEFSRVNLEAVLDGLKTLKLTIQVADEEGRVFNSTSKTLPVEVNKTYRVGFGNQFALKAILGSKDLKPHTSTSTTIDETWLIQALSVNTAGALTKCENLKGEYCNMQELKPIVTFLFEFAITSRGDLNRLRFNLRHIGCIHDSNGEVLYVNYISDPVDPFSTRSSVKQLFEISGLLSWEGVEPKWEKTEYGLKGIMPIGGMLIERGNQEVAIQDWIIAREAIEKIRLSEKKLKEALTSISKCANIRPDAPEILSNAIAMAFAQRLERLYTYQECATSEILSLLTKENYGSRSVDVVVIQARTAGGKTYAFLLPIFLYLINSKLMGGRKGVEFILLYPTVALANDQADEILKFLYFVNLQLYGKEISLGILNQYIESRYPKGEYQASGVGLRLGCPLCGALLELSFEEKAGEKGCFRLERATCSNPECELSKKDSVENKVLNSSLRLTREAVYSSRPEILITTPDFINARLTLQGEEDPMALSILGKSFSYCMDCGKVYKPDARTCRDGCGGRLVQGASAHPIRGVVIDEAHLFKGEFGAQVSHLILRMEVAVRKLFGLESYRPLYIVSSATLSNAKNRASELVVCDRDRVKVIEPEYLTGSEPLFRHHVIIMPKTYRPEATAERALEVPFGCVYGMPDVRGRLDNPKALVFVNSISQANDLVNHFGRMLGKGDVRVGGHTTDWHGERAKVEDEFLKGRIDLLVATRGLEVGVDFDKISVGVIFGVPYYISDYVQRIGRIGRKSDSIIINVLTPDRNVNFFYYMNWHLLSDPNYREKHMRLESGMINNRNIVALERCAKRVALDWVSVMYPFKGVPLNPDDLPSKITSFFLGCISPLGLDNKIKTELLSSLREFISKQEAWQLKDPERIIRELKKVNRIGYLSDLRSFDDQVEVRVGGTEFRNRNLSIMFRRSMEGMIYSYRGRYYTVETVNGSPAFDIIARRVNL